ncbi:hypothetical protein TWF694_009087 [Orbilia ellipsospora]|uniref:Uncharacterized protein n=1 Tax=Orbilia ellipsospora TaxID=2528407 RepID=A0AAV9XFC3_9PEZI
MSNLQPGNYYKIESVEFIDPETPPKTRSLAVEGGTLVLAPEGAEPTKFLFEASMQESEGMYRISVDQGHLVPNGGGVSASVTVDAEWNVVRSAPCPPPVGNNTFVIYQGPAGPGSDAINPGSGPVELKSLGYPWWIRPVA